MPNVTAADIEKMKQQDLLTEMLIEAGRELPTLVEVMLHERDRYMAHALQAPRRFVRVSRTAEEALQSGQQLTVVAVVGLGHVKGIEEQFGREHDVQSLLTVPPKRMLTLPKVMAVAASVAGVAVWMLVRYVRRR